MKNGTRVIITDKSLKSYNHKGTFVGMNDKENGYKIYLDIPVKCGNRATYLVTLTNNESFEIIFDTTEDEQIKQFCVERIENLEKQIEYLKRILE